MFSNDDDPRSNSVVCNFENRGQITLFYEPNGVSVDIDGAQSAIYIDMFERKVGDPVHVYFYAFGVESDEPVLHIVADPNGKPHLEEV